MSSPARGAIKGVTLTDGPYTCFHCRNKVTGPVIVWHGSAAENVPVQTMFHPECAVEFAHRLSGVAHLSLERAGKAHADDPPAENAKVGMSGFATRPHVCALPDITGLGIGTIWRCVCWREYVVEAELDVLLDGPESERRNDAQRYWSLLDNSLYALRRPMFMRVRQR